MPGWGWGLRAIRRQQSFERVGESEQSLNPSDTLEGRPPVLAEDKDGATPSHIFTRVHSVHRLPLGGIAPKYLGKQTLWTSFTVEGAVSPCVYKGRVAIPFWEPLFMMKMCMFSLYRIQFAYGKMQNGLRKEDFCFFMVE